MAATDSEVTCAHCAGNKALVRTCDCQADMVSLESGVSCSANNLCVPGCTTTVQGSSRRVQFQAFIAARQKPVNGAYPTGFQSALFFFVSTYHSLCCFAVKSDYIQAVDTAWQTYQASRATAAQSSINGSEERMRAKYAKAMREGKALGEARASDPGTNADSLTPTLNRIGSIRHEARS